MKSYRIHYAVFFFSTTAAQALKWVKGDEKRTEPFPQKRLRKLKVAGGSKVLKKLDDY